MKVFMSCCTLPASFDFRGVFTAPMRAVCVRGAKVGEIVRLMCARVLTCAEFLYKIYVIECSVIACVWGAGVCRRA